MFTNATHVSRSDRRVIYIFDGPLLTEEEFQDDVWNRRIKVEFEHNKTTKRYAATVWGCAAGKREGYTMERHTIFSGDNAPLLNTFPVARFGANAFAAFIASAIEECTFAASNSYDESKGAALLREAKSFVTDMAAN